MNIPMGKTTLCRANLLTSKIRYTPEVGDLVIGRIVDVGAQRWRVDANGRQDAVLMLSSVNLPGGVQRRKIESDALKMREFLAEGDVSSQLPMGTDCMTSQGLLRNSCSLPKFKHSSETVPCHYIRDH